ncbi:phage major capsid protein [Pseudomonas aeruginosa]|uniref:phage major capsid protein n=1 Tax=Pseudomonas aeruginosa TaxID=287 RepID=UPI0003D6A590|nr:phage major capsid protein [Pseudomonas aeruginosa]HCL2778304.1 phage major capsid protein [Pseudomonas aeruginosa AC9A]AHC75487.1 Phage major capsid protein [Pseudomonas aeruginosa SCV20265]MCS8671772.1 phage major capsid protein [Pseudomonas aeruginosa]MCS8825706.1 phage major capsid protein [Pseudomonas aeruginosa]MCS8876588.1 phage major capsid protein [Pseudomonas aeruginosa]
MSQLEQEYKQVQADLKKVGDDLRTYAEQSEKELKVHSKLSEETKASVDKLLVSQGELQARLQAAEQLMAKLEKGGGRIITPESMGETFVAAEGYDAWAARAAGGAKGSFTVPVKAAITSLTGSAGDLIQPQRVGMVLPTQQRLFVRDLLAWGRTTSNSIEYVRETGFTNNAAPVSENPQNPKPESDITFELDTDPVATIAHWVRASRQVLSDAPMLASYIDGRLRYGLKLKEEMQLLKGSGVGLNLNGLYTQASIYANPGVVVQAETAIDRLRLALLQVTLAEYDADGIVLSPVDWAAIELTKDKNNNYVFATPTGLAVPGLWGRPVVASKSMDIGDFLTGSFQQGAEGWDREDVSVTVSTEDRDNLVKNMVTILCEERVGLSVFRPEAFVKGDFDGLPAS